jgi:hypothetical protein
VEKEWEKKPQEVWQVIWRQVASEREVAIEDQDVLEALAPDNQWLPPEDSMIHSLFKFEWGMEILKI